MPNKLTYEQLEALVRSLDKRHMKAQRTIQELKKALMPFAQEADRYDRLVCGEDIDGWRLTTSELTLGDCRRARAALKGDVDE